MAGFRSRWMTPAACIWASPVATERSRWRASGRERGPRSSRAFKRLALQKLVDEVGAAVPCPTSWSVTTVGWWTRAAASPSRRIHSRVGGASPTLRTDDLDRDAALEVGVFRLEHQPEAAPPDLPDQEEPPDAISHPGAGARGSSGTAMTSWSRRVICPGCSDGASEMGSPAPRDSRAPLPVSLEDDGMVAFPRDPDATRTTPGGTMKPGLSDGARFCETPRPDVHDVHDRRHPRRRQAGRPHQLRRGRSGCAARSAPPRPATPARSTRPPPACWPSASTTP